MSIVCYEDVAEAIGRMVDKKNHAYGDSFHRSGEIIRILYPSGIRPEQVNDLLAIIRIVDKMFRIATDRDALGENPWHDIAGYAVLKSRDLYQVPMEDRQEFGPAGPPSGLGGGCR